jgi:hypothetical protein
MNIDGLRLISDLDVKLLRVAGFNRPGNLLAILHGDDVGEEPAG